MCTNITKIDDLQAEQCDVINQCVNRVVTFSFLIIIVR